MVTPRFIEYVIVNATKSYRVKIKLIKIIKSVILKLTN